MITHQGELGHPLWSGECDEIGEIFAPRVFGSLGQYDYPFRRKRVNRTLIMGNKNNRALKSRERGEDLLAAGRVQVVGVLDEHQHNRTRKN